MKIKASGNALTGCATRLNYIESYIILFKKKTNNKRNKNKTQKLNKKKITKPNYVVVTSNISLCSFLIDL